MKILKPHPDAVELENLRAKHSKTFAMPDGTRRLEHSIAHVHYQDARGAWLDCDPQLVVGPGGQISATGVAFSWRLHRAGVGYDFQAGAEPTISMTLLGAAPNQNPVVSGNRVTFSEVFPGIDIEFVVLDGRVKTLRTIKDAAAAKSCQWRVEHGPESAHRVRDGLRGRDAAKRELDLSRSQDGNIVTETWSGKTKVRDPITRVKSLSDEVAWPVVVDPTVAFDITNDHNDGYEIVGFLNFANSGYISYDLLGFKGSYVNNPGWLFDSVNVPQGATISSATLSLNVTTGYGLHIGNYGAGTIYGYNADNPVDGIFTASPIHTSSRTSHSTAVPRPTGTGIVNYDVTGIVQDIVNRAGFASGHNLAMFAISGESANTHITYFEDLYNAGTHPAHLSITYSAAAGLKYTQLERGTRGVLRGSFLGGL